MDKLTINGQEYELHYGLRFIREMDARHALKKEGISFGFGIASALIYLQDGNPTILADIIQSATATEKRKPTVKEIEQFLEEDDTDLQELFDGFLKALETSKLTKQTVERLNRGEGQS